MAHRVPSSANMCGSQGELELDLVVSTVLANLTPSWDLPLERHKEEAGGSARRIQRTRLPPISVSVARVREDIDSSGLQA